jgi:hypothetical protein
MFLPQGLGETWQPTAIFSKSSGLPGIARDRTNVFRGRQIVQSKRCDAWFGRRRQMDCAPRMIATASQRRSRPIAILASVNPSCKYFATRWGPCQSRNPSLQPRRKSTALGSLFVIPIAREQLAQQSRSRITERIDLYHRVSQQARYTIVKAEPAFLTPVEVWLEQSQV